MNGNNTWRRICAVAIAAMVASGIVTSLMAPTAMAVKQSYGHWHYSYNYWWAANVGYGVYKNYTNLCTTSTSPSPTPAP